MNSPVISVIIFTCDKVMSTVGLGDINMDLVNERALLCLIMSAAQLREVSNMRNLYKSIKSIEVEESEGNYQLGGRRSCEWGCSASGL